jgi:hypothetical protein
MATADAREKIDDELRRIRADLVVRERQIGNDAARIARLLEEDFPAYLLREAKARFLAAPAFAEAMTPEALARLKRELNDEGRRVGASINGELADATRWLLDIEEATAPLELRDFPEVWGRMVQWAATLDAVLGRYGFPADTAEYRPPTWFVGGALLKTLLEGLHARLLDRSRLRRAVQALESERHRKVLELKWEASG